MYCEECEPLLPLLALDELEAERKAPVEAHAAECAVCRQKLDDLRATLQLLNEAAAQMPQPHLSAERRKALSEAALAQTASAPKQPRRPRFFATIRRPINLTWARASQLAAAAILVFVGAWFLASMYRSNATSYLQQSDVAQDMDGQSTLYPSAVTRDDSRAGYSVRTRDNIVGKTGGAVGRYRSDDGRAGSLGAEVRERIGIGDGNYVDGWAAAPERMDVTFQQGQNGHLGTVDADTTPAPALTGPVAKGDATVPSFRDTITLNVSRANGVFETKKKTIVRQIPKYGYYGTVSGDTPAPAVTGPAANADAEVLSFQEMPNGYTDIADVYWSNGTDLKHPRAFGESAKVSDPIAKGGSRIVEFQEGVFPSEQYTMTEGYYSYGTQTAGDSFATVITPIGGTARMPDSGAVVFDNVVSERDKNNLKQQGVARTETETAQTTPPRNDWEAGSKPGLADADGYKYTVREFTRDSGKIYTRSDNESRIQPLYEDKKGVIPGVRTSPAQSLNPNGEFYAEFQDESRLAFECPSGTEVLAGDRPTGRLDVGDRVSGLPVAENAKIQNRGTAIVGGMMEETGASAYADTPVREQVGQGTLPKLLGNRALLADTDGARERLVRDGSGTASYDQLIPNNLESAENKSVHAQAAKEMLEDNKDGSAVWSFTVWNAFDTSADADKLPGSGKEALKDSREPASQTPPVAQAPKAVEQDAALWHEDTNSYPAPVFHAGPVNPWVMSDKDALSTFALDVDTASYAICRDYIRRGTLPPAASVRMEEYVNAFDYNYPTQAQGVFSIHAESAASPFRPELTLLKIGVRAKVLGREARKPAHLVFVVDTSGSMERADRLPLVQYALGELVGQLGPNDRVTLVTFGMHSSLVLNAASASDPQSIVQAVNSIRCAGSTNLFEGLRTGYQLAASAYQPGAINRVILCSDGVANIGSAEADTMLQSVEEFRKQGVTLTVVGFGHGIYDDTLLERLADRGDGNYVFVDSQAEARRVFVEEMAGTLQTVARNAKIQVAFDPAVVRRYRLIGFENRDIADADFRNDAVIAGGVGSGQSSTALYEVELQPAPEHGAALRDVGTVFVRYEDMDTGRVDEISQRLEPTPPCRAASPSPRFTVAACAAEFAEILRGSEHVKNSSFDRVSSALESAAAQLPLDGRVRELLEMTRKANGLPRAQ